MNKNVMNKNVMNKNVMNKNVMNKNVMNKNVMNKNSETARLLLVGVSLVAAALFTSPAAGAEPALPAAGAESASATVSDLQALGYNVSVNYPQGHPNVPLNECRVGAINNPSAPSTTPSLVTVYVDVLCPNAK